jgi:hypothetical protein
LKSADAVLKSNAGTFHSTKPVLGSKGVLRFKKLMWCEITNDNFFHQIKISHCVLFSKVSTSITFFSPDMKPAKLVLHSAIAKLLKK